MKRTLTGYIVSEILPPFLLGLAAFTLVLLVARIIRLVELVVTRGVPFLQIGKLFALILPTFLEMTVPMALLLAIFLGLGRLSGDHEILALKASGISPTQILLPIATVALFISLVTLLLTTLVRPAANLALKKELYNIAKSRLGTALKEKVFNDDFPQLLIYVEEVVPPGDTSQGVLIVDRRNPTRENILFGKVALILSDEESKTINFKLFDGTIYEREKKRPSFTQTRFSTYDFKLDLEEAFSPMRKKERGPKEMSLRRLGKAIQAKEEQGLRPTAELIELHQRFAFAFAPLVLSLLGVSLVMVPTRSRAGRSWGFALCLTWLLVYYGLLSMGKALGERNLLPPALALWLPNMVVGVIAFRLFRKALTESPLLVQTKLEDLSLYLNRRLHQLMQRDLR
ncbi:MAG: LPS export ABC transporter permease LptF [Deltaproteobacteria bacterium]|nr:LPS export ABC transporter permease LptF [Deltaproteobacteria bacterium]